MNWRDFFYFSKGERRAFTLLLSLVTISWWLLHRTTPEPMPIYTETNAYQKKRTQASDKQAVTIRKETFIQQKKKEISFIQIAN